MSERTRGLLLKNRGGLVVLLLVVVTLAVYLQVRNFDFVGLDDRTYVTGNLHVQQGLDAKSVGWAFTTFRGSNWHPLTWISHIVDFRLFGMNPRGHHLTNLFFHAASAALLFLVLGAMTGALWRSALVAALFALHPLHVESVAWVSERKDVLSAFFWFLTMGAYLRYAVRPSAARYLAVALCFALGLMGKPMLVTLPVVLLLLDFWPLGRLAPPGGGAPAGRRPSLRSLLAEKVPLLALSALTAGVTLYAPAREGTLVPLEAVPLGLRAANALTSWVAYLGKMLLPVRLAVLYPYPEAVPALHAAGAFLFLAAVTFLAVRQRSKRPWLTVGWLWYLVTLLPVIGLFQVGEQSMADRYTYLPLVGIYAILAWGAAEAASALRLSAPLRVLPAAVALAALALLTWRQAGFWRDDVSLYEHTLDVTGENPVVAYNLGVALYEKGMVDEAIAQYRRVIETKPQAAKVYGNLGVALSRQGRHEEALEQFLKALQLRPEDAATHVNLGAVLSKLGRVDEAVAQYREALRIEPGDEAANSNLGNLLAGTGREEEAAGRYEAALRSNPRSAAAHHNLGYLRLSQGRVDEAVGHLEEATRITPGYGDAQFHLGLALAAKGRTEEAVGRYVQALRIDPGRSEVHYYLGVALMMRGDVDGAVASFREATRLKPGYMEAHNNLGIALARKGDLEGAVSSFREALRIDPDSDFARRNLERALKERQ